MLKTIRFGEIHRQAVILTERFGILHAAAYGACKGKSRLAGMVEPFNTMVLNLYHEPVKNNYKIQDVGEVLSHESLKGSIGKYGMASLITEIVLKSYGGGEHRKMYTLTAETLDILDAVPEKDLWYTGIQFLWRFFHITGFSPSLDTCAQCGCRLAGEEDKFFSNRHGGFACIDCSDPGTVRISSGALKYLGYTETVSLSDAVRVRLQERDLHQLRNALTQAAESLLETPLKSLKSLEETV